MAEQSNAIFDAELQTFLANTNYILGNDDQKKITFFLSKVPTTERNKKKTVTALLQTFQLSMTKKAYECASLLFDVRIT